MDKFMKTAVCIAAAALMLTFGVPSYAAPSESPAVTNETAATAAPEETAPPETGESEETAPPETDEPEETAMPEDAAPPETNEPETAAVPAPSAPTSAKLDFTVQMAKRKYVIDSFIELEVYDKAGTLIGTNSAWIGGITESVDLHYDVPEYEIGEQFTVKLVGGVDTLRYYDTVIRPGESFEVGTSCARDENGELVLYDSFIFSAVPLWEKEVIVYSGGSMLRLSPRARIVEGNTMVPVRAVAKSMGISVYYDKNYDSVVCSVGDKQVIYNLGHKYANFFGEDRNLPVAPRYFDGSAYIPARSLAEAFEAPLEVKDFGDHLDVIIGESDVVRRSEPVNSWNISSRTGYMVWVSKSEYTVRVYEGSKNKWRKIYTAPCAIGAPGTPTITGSFEYIERTFWDYGSYYVAPVLRFYNGYALHSVLLYYGGGEYDGRVGTRISHGCVRLKERDINWIADTIPLYTRIYITD